VEETSPGQPPLQVEETSPGQPPLQMELTSPFFLLKHDEPCKDVLHMQFDSAPPRSSSFLRQYDSTLSIRSSSSLSKCGYLPQMETFRTGGVRLTFQSDNTDQEMGFVIRFRGEGG